ncbi:MAG: sugar phosphorylase [Opitutaceae bacterium]|jgi:sucrose phosphorylase|nr:sugar phosphorylase [Opitutaceae bacterium]
MNTDSPGNALLHHASPRTLDAIKDSIRRRVEFLYPDAASGDITTQLITLALDYSKRIATCASGWSHRDALLITYADTICENGLAPLHVLDHFLSTHIGDAVTLVHLLPFFPFSSDDGFSVIDYREVRPELGSWSDILKLATKYRIVTDAVVNHVSKHSRYMQGHCAGDPDYEDFVITLDPGANTRQVLRTRNLPLLHPNVTRRGLEYFWTTFSPDQVDLNFKNPKVLVEMTSVLLFYIQNGASVLRLDAIPYLWKEIGTSCAHLPQTHEIIKLWRDIIDIAAPHVLLLTETNVPHDENLSYFGNAGNEAQIIYNFTLPPLLLWSLHSGDASPLTQSARTLGYISPRATYLNITATHDGIGMRPTEGILRESQRDELCELARRHGGDITGKTNPDGSLSVYELNITYFDAINNPNDTTVPLSVQIDRFILSQAVPMALMGIPAFYLPSLLGSRNAAGLVAQTGHPRSINRPSFDMSSLTAELAAPGNLRAVVFGRLRALLRIRSGLDAFHPDAAQEIIDQGPSLFLVRRESRKPAQTIIAAHNVTARSAAIALPAGRWHDAITGETASGQTALPAYAIRWYVRSS